MITTNQKNKRISEFPVDPIFLNRWSPRAMSGKVMTREELMPLFEAAKWAPSAYNVQPWRFLFALKNTVHWETFFNLLSEPNQLWTKNAAALVVIISKKTNDTGKENKTHSFDTGAAWENLALQASKLGFVAHGMSGFDYEKAKTQLQIPDDFQVEAMVAIGIPGEIENLPEKFQAAEKPNSRIPLSEIIFEGKFKPETEIYE